MLDFKGGHSAMSDALVLAVVWQWLLVDVEETGSEITSEIEAELLGIIIGASSPTNGSFSLCKSEGNGRWSRIKKGSSKSTVLPVSESASPCSAPVAWFPARN